MRSAKTEDSFAPRLAQREIWASISNLRNRDPMAGQNPKLREVWKQNEIPIIYRQASDKPLLVRLPYASSNRAWLKNGRRTTPRWDAQHQCWQVPRSWLNKLAKRLLRRFGHAYIVQPFSRKRKCAPPCWNALGADCECSCMGRNSGSRHPPGKWHVVAKTFSGKWGLREVSCRLIKWIEENQMRKVAKASEQKRRRNHAADRIGNQSFPSSPAHEATRDTGASKLI